MAKEPGHVRDSRPDFARRPASPGVVHKMHGLIGHRGPDDRGLASVDATTGAISAHVEKIWSPASSVKNMRFDQNGALMCRSRS